MKKVLLSLVAVSTLALVGCGEAPADYEQKVELTPAQQEQAEKNMEGQQMPGAITPGQPVDSGQPSGEVSMPPGKSGG